MVTKEEVLLAANVCERLAPQMSRVEAITLQTFFDKVLALATTNEEAVTALGDRMNGAAVTAVLK